VRRKLRVHPRQIQSCIDLAHEMTGRNNVIEMELIKQLALIALQPPHHRKPPPLSMVRGRNHWQPTSATESANSCRFATAPHRWVDWCSPSSFA